MNQRLHAIFANNEVDAQAYSRMVKRPLPRHRFVVYFTPRSGSSWLTDVLGQTRSMGCCNEVFNPGFMPNIASACNASNIHEYIEAIQRRLVTNDAFSFEITFHQLRAIFPGEQVFLRNFRDCPSFWLVREDIVEQAVSLAKMVTTSVAHSPSASADDRVKSDTKFEYNPNLITKWLRHILAAERDNEDFFERTGIEPLRMSYERMFNISTNRLIRIMCDHAGIEELKQETIKHQHEKIGTLKNKEFAERYRQEERALIEEIADERSPWLARLEDLSELK